MLLQYYTNVAPDEVVHLSEIVSADLKLDPNMENLPYARVMEFRAGRLQPAKQKQQVMREDMHDRVVMSNQLQGHQANPSDSIGPLDDSNPTIKFFGDGLPELPNVIHECFKNPFAGVRQAYNSYKVLSAVLDTPERCRKNPFFDQITCTNPYPDPHPNLQFYTSIPSPPKPTSRLCP